MLVITNNMKFSEMKLGQSGTVAKILCDGIVRTRLLDIGIHPGVSIMLKWTAPLGDPFVAEVGDTLIGIRKKDAANIEVDI